MKGVANDEAGCQDYRVKVVPEGPLEKLNGLSKPKKRKEQRPADYRSPKSEVDPRPARTLISTTVHRT